jgi:hypothetical protein
LPVGARRLPGNAPRWPVVAGGRGHGSGRGRSLAVERRVSGFPSAAKCGAAPQNDALPTAPPPGAPAERPTARTVESRPFRSVPEPGCEAANGVGFGTRCAI